MKRACFSLAMVALGAVLAISPLNAQTCSIGGHNETSENFNPGDWSIPSMSPGTVPASVVGTHLLISEVAPRGAGTGVASDSSEYIEIYNPTTRPIRLDNKYISDDINYFRVVNGVYPAANNSDWTLRFPPGLALLPGRTLILCVTKAGFAGSGASPGPAQYFLEMKDSNGNPADDMVIMTTVSAFLVTGGSLTNPSNINGEWVVLFCWNGASDRVCDIDYASWGANSASNPKMDKTGIAIDGPDAGAATSAFNADTPAAAQSNLGNSTTLTKPSTYQRIGGENSEVPFNGNGCLGLITPTISWLPVTGATGDPNVRFMVRWTNQDDDAGSGPVNGTLNSQAFGVFLPDYGQIGSFSVPPLAPSSFFDVFIEIPLSQLPPSPDKHVGGGPGPQTLGSYVESQRGRGGPRITNDCPPDTNWAGNVDLIWSGPGGNGQVNKHYSDIMVCAGGAPSYIHLRFNNCTGPMPWSAVGLCPGFTSTLVNEDLTPAPNPVPPGWTGYICINAAAVVPSGTTCCFGIVFQCLGVSSTIDICATACNCQPVPPTLGSVTWTVNGGIVTFQQHWENPNSSPSDPVGGTMNSQPFGVFLPDFGPIGQFNVPPIPPNSFFDIFIDIPLGALPPNPTVELPGGGPPPGSPCEPPEHWHGNVNIAWNGPGGTGQVFKHFADVPVCPGAGPTYLFVETDCTGAAGSPWNVIGVCPGFSVTLVNPDNTPAPNPVPPGWIGKICVQATAATPSGVTCCFAIRFLCNGVVGTIDVCAKTCDWGPKKPVLAATDWTRVGSNVRFHMLWRNPDGSNQSDPVSGTMNSQPFGVFAPDFGHIGQFNVPPIPPSSFFDVFIEIPLSDLPPEPQEILPGGGPGPGSPCPPDTSWSGNVDIQWAGPGGSGIVGRHFTTLLVRPGTGSSHIHALMFCNSALGASWTIAGLCPGWSATLLNEDFTPAPNPVPANWTGWISVAAANSVPPGASCCFTVTFLCDGQPGVIDVCAEACQWPNSGVSNRTGAEFGIYSTAPNPASTQMSIAFAMPKAGPAKLEVFNLTGQRVRTLFAGQANAGVNSVRWDARGENGRTLAAGAYFVTLKAGERVSTKKIVLFH